MSVTPFPKSEVVFGSHALLESTTTLAFGANLFSNTVETVDILPGRHHSRGFGGIEAGTIYDYQPADPDPRFILDYYIYAEAAAGAPARGSLLVWGEVLTPATPPVFPGIKLLHHVLYGGNQLCYGTTSAGFTYTDSAMKGTLRVSARKVSVQYFNSAVAQTVFRIGVYLRAA